MEKSKRPKDLAELERKIQSAQRTRNNLTVFRFQFGAVLKEIKSEKE